MKFMSCCGQTRNAGQEDMFSCFVMVREGAFRRSSPQITSPSITSLSAGTFEQASAILPVRGLVKVQSPALEARALPSVAVAVVPTLCPLGCFLTVASLLTLEPPKAMVCPARVSLGLCRLYRPVQCGACPQECSGLLSLHLPWLQLSS